MVQVETNKTITEPTQLREPTRFLHSDWIQLVDLPVNNSNTPILLINLNGLGFHLLLYFITLWEDIILPLLLSCIFFWILWYFCVVLFI